MYGKNVKKKPLNCLEEDVCGQIRQTDRQLNPQCSSLVYFTIGQVCDPSFYTVSVKSPPTAYSVFC
jgi:hypothetical protein